MIKSSTALFIIITSIILVSCNENKNKQNKNLNNKTELKFKEYSFDNPPIFRKDGELSFFDKNTNLELFHIDTEIASTDETRARGLMFRKEMDEKNGMIFLFSKDEIQSFYMHNTLISLDILYVNSKMEIVDIYKNTNTLDDTSLPSKFPAMYVIEINAGLCDKYNIEIGDFIKFR